MRIVFNARAPAREAGVYLTRLLRKEGDILLLLSGGSALKLLAYAEPDVLGPHVTISVVDERYTRDPAESNFSRLSATDFFARAQSAGCSFIDPRLREGETLAGAASRFEASLRAWRAEHPAGRIISTLGFGADGHTAGIAPYPADPARFGELFEDEACWVRGYDADGKLEPPKRMTLTASFLMREVDAVVVFACGEKKRAALARIAAERGTRAETPARVSRGMKNAAIFTDIRLAEDVASRQARL